MFSKLSRGSLEYERCSELEIDKVTSVTAQDNTIQKIVGIGGISTIVMIGVIVGTFTPKFKYHKIIRHDSKNPKCKCKACLTKLDEKLIESVKPKDPITEEDKKETPKENTIIAPIVRGKIDESGGDGSIKLEKNVLNKVKSEDEVLKQNTGFEINHG